VLSISITRIKLLITTHHRFRNRLNVVHVIYFYCGGNKMANKDRPSKNLPKKKDSDVLDRLNSKKEERREAKKELKLLKRRAKRSGYVPTAPKDD